MKYFDNYCENVCKYKGEKKVHKPLGIYDWSGKIDTIIEIPICPCDYCQIWHYNDKIYEDVIWKKEREIDDLQTQIWEYEDILRG